MLGVCGLWMVRVPHARCSREVVSGYRFIDKLFKVHMIQVRRLSTVYHGTARIHK